MRNLIRVTFGLFAVLATGLIPARAVESVWEYSVQVSSTVQASPAKITLSWPQDVNGTPSGYTVYRKAPGASSWGAGTTLAGSATTYIDTNVVTGTSYEYRIDKAGGGYTGYGYVQTGINAQLVDNRGKVLLIVDNTIAAPLAVELTRLQQDLAGDGWTVVRRDVGRTDSVASVKAVIKSAYDADPANVKSVFLFGHVPVPYSGQLNPDGHGDHVGAWPADAFYGDIDGNWTDSSVNYTQTVNTDPADAARLSNRPGDGKFDQTQLPSAIELEVGRVDLSNMPGRTTWGGPATFASEIELLRKYLNKDHNFRHRVTNPARRAVVGDYFGSRGGEAFAASGFRSFAPLVGANNIRNLNVEFNDQKGVWIPQASQNDYLLAYACGAGSYASISGIGNGIYNTGYTTELVSSNTRGVFNLLFGSWLGDWDHEDNILRAPLATDHGLVSAWSGRPHWFIHTIGLGDTIGSAARLTQNNNGLYQTAINSSANRIHIALMGDPTLRLHPVAPVATVNGTSDGSTAALSWSASSDSAIVGYHVYRAASLDGPFTRLTSSPITATNYSATGASNNTIFMVRAIKLESTTSGSYYNASQGTFWTVGGGSSSGGSTTTPPVADVSAPSIAIAGPSANATVSGASVAVTANATDNVGVTGVQFKLNGANLGAEVNGAPFRTTLNTTTLPNGTHTLSAVARDAVGNMASASVISITVSNTTSGDGSTAGGSVGGGSSSGGSSGGTTATPAGTVVWVEDSLPAGAAAMTNGDTWNWVTVSPAPFSGTRAHKSDPRAGLHEHSFAWGTPLNVAAGDVLFTYVYLDPSALPTQIMLSFFSNNWEHRVYWGANQISYGTNNTASRYRAGDLPAAGQWVRLEVPASALALEGASVSGMSFSTFNGSVTWDQTGKALPGSATSIPPTTTPITSPGTAPTTPAITGTDTVWFDDAVPAGASGGGSGGDGWNWITSGPTPFSGTKAHQSNLAVGLHEHYFAWASSPLTPAVGEKLFTYVYLDPANPPTEIMISFGADNWEHRAYWGANQISYGTNGSASRYYAGALPATGQWVRLEVPASAVALEGKAITMMSFSLFNGRAAWDKTGKTSVSSATTPTVTPPITGGTPALTAADSTWVDDALPLGAGGGGTWNWLSGAPTAFSGTKAHQSTGTGLHEHYFAWAAPLTVATGNKLFVYVYLDAGNMPEEIMLSWYDGSWEHRAFWGANKISYGTTGTAGRYRAGDLPAGGQWVRLELPASAVDLEGKAINGMSFSAFGGRVTWDVTGKTLPTN